MKRAQALVLAAVAVIAACGPKNSLGTLDATGFHAKRQPYEVASRGDEVASSDWLISNFRFRDGEPVVPKSGDRFEFNLAIDADDDGENDHTRSEPRYDLLLEHRRSDGVLWISTIPLPTREAETRLDVLMDRYVEAVSGAGSVTTSVQDGDVSTREQSYATRVTDRAEAQLDGREAYVATVEVANVDQLSLSPDARWMKARIALVRPPFGYTPPRIDGSREAVVLPAIMMVGYSNRPEDFEESLPDFSDLLGRIRFSNSPDHLRRAMLDCGVDDGMVQATFLVGSGATRIVRARPSSAEECLEAAADGWEPEDTGEIHLVVHRYYQGASPYGSRPDAVEASAAVGAEVEASAAVSAEPDTSSEPAPDAEEGTPEATDEAPEDATEDVEPTETGAPEPDDDSG